MVPVWEAFYSSVEWLKRKKNVDFLLLLKEMVVETPLHRMKRRLLWIAVEMRKEGKEVEGQRSCWLGLTISPRGPWRILRGWFQKQLIPLKLLEGNRRMLSWLSDGQGFLRTQKKH